MKRSEPTTMTVEERIYKPSNIEVLPKHEDSSELQCENIMALKRRRDLVSSDKVDGNRKEVENDERIPSININDADLQIKSLVLSPLKNFRPISTLIAEGGDVSRRVETILSMFGSTTTDTVVTCKAMNTRRNRRSPVKGVDLYPTYSSSGVGVARRRTYKSHLMKDKKP